jgi:hypothetical protein
MDYLFYSLFPWVAGAFLIGLIVGWYSCDRADDRNL